MQDIVIFGHTDFSELIAFYCEKYGMYRVRGYTVNRAYADGDVIPFDELDVHFPKGEVGILMTVGYTNMNENRKKLVEMLLAEGYRLVDFISPRAIVHGDIGRGNILLDDVVVHPFAKLGDFNYIVDHTLIGHHDVVGNYCYFAPSVSLSGHVTVEDNCFLGNNATARNGVTIGHHAMIGAAAYVSHDVKPYHMVIPAKCTTYDMGGGSWTFSENKKSIPKGHVSDSGGG